MNHRTQHGTSNARAHKLNSLPNHQDKDYSE